MSHFDLQIKLLMIGDSGVGKTCLLVRFANDSYHANGLNTIGIDFKIKNTVLEGKKIKLQIWDTAGQERFRTITTSYFRGAQGIVLVYDVTDKNTFVSIRSWMSQIVQHADANVSCVLIGNKCDSSKREVSKEEGVQLAREFKTNFFETSAMQNVMVDDAFNKVTADVMHTVLAAEERDRGGPGVKKQGGGQGGVVRVEDATQAGNKDKKSSGSCC